MIDFSNLNTAYGIPTTGYYGGPQPPPGTNPQPGLPPAGSPFYQIPNPLQGVIQGAENFIIGAATSLILPFIGPFIIVGIVLLVAVAAVVGGGAFMFGMILND